MNIIAIQGNKNSGKDTISEFLQYLLNTNKIFHNYYIFKILKNIIKYNKSQYHIIKYADKIKQMLSTLLNVELDLFEDRDFKENYYIDFNTLKIYNKSNIPENLLILSDSKFSKELKRNNLNIAKEYMLSIRQLLQFYGTEVMRSIFGNNLWVITTLRSNYTNFIISDQRFINEYHIITKHGGISIHIKRPDCVIGTHSSETELQYLEDNNLYNYIIQNDGNLKDLFKKSKELINNLKNKNND